MNEEIMPLCPYCNNELDVKLSLKPVEFDQEFKEKVLQAIGTFLEIQAECMPFGKSFAKMGSKMVLKFANRYFDKIGAFPVTLLSCKNCDNVITADVFQSSEYFTSMGGGPR
ncbi:MAG: hypothetical protein JXA99_13745 [Candidatus Lokiarchaeota archaeon]|nr:hypothetical protein [Candidatus Lokiarchaeota archaeon]